MELFLGDCLDILPGIQDKSIDMIFTDLPYGTTRNGWDCMIDLKRLWEHYGRIIKDNGCIALWAQSPFAAKMPMKCHENVLIFYKHLPTYNPQITTGHSPVHSYTKHVSDGSNYGKTRTGISGGGSTERYPRDVLRFKWDTQRERLHPTQKPLEACKYFIRTYTNSGDTVLDSCMGSNTTGVACQELGREYIGIEKDTVNYRIALDRVDFKFDGGAS